jgi:hypothetical protein
MPSTPEDPRRKPVIAVDFPGIAIPRVFAEIAGLSPRRIRQSPGSPGKGKTRPGMKKSDPESGGSAVVPETRWTAGAARRPSGG